MGSISCWPHLRSKSEVLIGVDVLVGDLGLFRFFVFDLLLGRCFFLRRLLRRLLLRLLPSEWKDEEVKDDDDDDDEDEEDDGAGEGRMMEGVDANEEDDHDEDEDDDGDEGGENGEDGS